MAPKKLPHEKAPRPNPNAPRALICPRCGGPKLWNRPKCPDCARAYRQQRLEAQGILDVKAEVVIVYHHKCRGCPTGMRYQFPNGKWSAYCNDCSRARQRAAYEAKQLMLGRTVNSPRGPRAKETKPRRRPQPIIKV